MYKSYIILLYYTSQYIKRLLYFINMLQKHLFDYFSFGEGDPVPLNPSCKYATVYLQLFQ